MSRRSSMTQTCASSGEAQLALVIVRHFKVVFRCHAFAVTCL